MYYCKTQAVKFSIPELPICWGLFQRRSNQDMPLQEPEVFADEILSGILMFQLHHNPHWL
jgi:hypothetical protein